MKYKNGLSFGLNPIAFTYRFFPLQRYKFFVLHDIISFCVYLAFLFYTV